MECPSAKKSRLDYKVCGHCHKELNLKIYKEHKRLYYNPVSKSWVQLEDDKCDVQGSDESSSDLSSIDDVIDFSSDNAAQGEHVHQHSDESDEFLWEEPLSTPEDADKGIASYRYDLFQLPVLHVFTLTELFHIPLYYATVHLFL